MRRSFAPAEGTDERGGWDQCLDLRPGERRAAVKRVLTHMDDPGNRDWSRGWMDAWDTFHDSSWERIRRLTNERGMITDPRDFEWEGVQGPEDVDLGRYD